jgi:hypothetical protein
VMALREEHDPKALRELLTEFVKELEPYQKVK